jgi:hypothetical protein
MDQENLHSDHQALWVNPKLNRHIVNGNDSGVNVLMMMAKTGSKITTCGWSVYYVNVDNQKPYNVYGGLQDNGVWYGPSDYKASNRWEASGVSL